MIVRYLFGGLKAYLGFASPIKIEHIVTTRCNLSCTHCTIKDVRCKEQCAEEIFVHMRRFRRMGAMSWYFGGGEPLLREDLPELVSYAKKLGYHTTANTNGILAEVKLDALRKLDVVGVSIDGPEEVHEHMRGKGTYAPALEALKTIKKNCKKVYIATVLSQGLLEHEGMEFMLSLARKHDVGIAFLPLYTHTDSQVIYPPLVRLEQIKRDEPGLLMMSPLALRSYRKGFRCTAGKDFVTLWPDGRVTNCRFSKTPGSCSCDNLCYREYSLLRHPLNMLDYVRNL